MSSTTREMISTWFDRAKAEGGTHMLVICDTFDYGDYPITAMSDRECLHRYENPGEMQRVMEVYDLRQDKDTQLAMGRCFMLPTVQEPR